MAIKYSDLTHEGKMAVIREAKKNGCNFSCSGDCVTLSGGDTYNCSKALAYNYEGGIYTDRARRS